jgi:hypothetical protein
LDPHDNAVLIDFKQFRSNCGRLAPEACGEWDVSVSEEGKLAYLPHQDMRPEEWNAFREWQDVPEALEVAEVHALGAALSALFEAQVPSTLQHVLKTCLEPDPLKRISLETVSHYFKGSDVQDA